MVEKKGYELAKPKTIIIQNGRFQEVGDFCSYDREPVANYHKVVLERRGRNQILSRCLYQLNKNCKECLDWLTKEACDECRLPRVKKLLKEVLEKDGFDEGESVEKTKGDGK